MFVFVIEARSYGISGIIGVSRSASLLAQSATLQARQPARDLYSLSNVPFIRAPLTLRSRRWWLRPEPAATITRYPRAARSAGGSAARWLIMVDER